MPTINYQVVASTDDARETAAGAVNVIGTYIFLSWAGCYGAMRFVGVTIPAGAIIDSANVEAEIFDANNDTFNTTIYGQKTATPAQFTTANFDISGRALTTANVAWSGTDVGVGWKTSPDLKAIIQELVDSYDYSGGLNLAIVFKGAPASLQVRVYSRDQGAANAPRLNITYTAAGGVPRKNMYYGRMRRN